jgi:hypothetical protein
MGYHLYLRQGTLFVPTTGLVEKGLLRDVEPVSAVPIWNTEGVRQALHATIVRGNPPTPHFSGGKYPQPVVLKYAGVKTWSAFARIARSWNIEEENGTYQIVGFRTHPKGYWEEDPDRKIEFPPGTTVDVVIDRMIAILQDAARSPD